MNEIIRQLLSQTITISESYERVAESTGEKFNIFSILQMETDEVSTHSKFIAELLNRKGSHGQKDRFLILFNKLFCADLDLNTEKSTVIIEYYIGKVETEKGGRIDILIKDDNGKVIMIENKIYASEQRNQLLRYHNAFPCGKLFYLTLFGEKSSQDISIEKYQIISYENDIINWLEECKKESVNIPILRESITQYINLIKKLTNQNLNKKMNQEIKKLVLKDKESLIAYRTLIDNQIQMDLKKDLIKEIVKKIEDRFVKLGYSNIITTNLESDKGLLVSIENDKMEKLNIKLKLNFEGKNYTGLIIGFCKNSSNKTRNSELFEKFKKEFPNNDAKQSDWWIAYFFYDNKYKNWFFPTLADIKFDESNGFYLDLEKKVEIMIKTLD